MHASKPHERKLKLSNTDLIPSERIEKAIYFIRGEKVMLDRDLALLYSVETKMLNRAVNRNLQRFPLDFMFQLTPEEADILRCQIGTSKQRPRWTALFALCFHRAGRGDAFKCAEQRTRHIGQIEIMRAFVKLRQMLASNAELSRHLNELESKYDKQFRVVFDAIRELMASPPRGPKQIGFRSRPVKK